MREYFLHSESFACQCICDPPTSVMREALVLGPEKLSNWPKVTASVALALHYFGLWLSGGCLLSVAGLASETAQCLLQPPPVFRGWKATNSTCLELGS
jgi:hypothetical protein